MPVWKRQSIVWLFVGPVLPDDEGFEQGENICQEQVRSEVLVFELEWVEVFGL